MQPRHRPIPAAHVQCHREDSVQLPVRRQRQLRLPHSISYLAVKTERDRWIGGWHINTECPSRRRRVLVARLILRFHVKSVTRVAQIAVRLYRRTAERREARLQWIKTIRIN